MNIRLDKTLRLIPFILMIGCIVLASNASAADDSIVMDDAGYTEAYIARKMQAMDKDGSGSIEKTEAGRAWRRLKVLDADKNNAVSLMELKKQKLNYLKTEGLNKLNIRYKETADEDLFMDLYYPAGQQVKDCPVVVYTHGGGWAAGSKHGAANASFAKVFTQLLDEGFAVASVNYRLWQKNSATTAMRDCVIDCKDAIRFMSKHHDQLKIDPNRFYVMGDSAGGQIAQMLLLSSPESLPGDRQLASARYKMVAGVSWYGPCDFEQTDLFNHDDRPDFRDRFGPRIAPPGTNGAKKLELYREMSPVNYLTKDSPPLLMIQGDKDTTIPVKHAYRMQKQADEIGAAVETVIVKNAGHNWRKVGAEIEPSRESIVDRTVKFFVASKNPSQHTPIAEVRSVSRMPEFSWDTVPLYVHIRKVKKFTDEELGYLAGFPLITLEKTTGSKSYGSTDAGTIEAAKAIKKVNPNAKVLFYRNAFVHYAMYSFDDQLDDIPDWSLKTKKGEDKVHQNKNRGYDTSNEALRKWWVDTADDVCKSPYVDGLFIDGSVKTLSGYLKGRLPKGKKEETIAGYRDMMTATRKALGPEKLMVANIIRARFPQSGLEYMNYFDGSYLECFIEPAGTKLSKKDYLAKGIEATQTAARQGKIIAMTLGLGESGVSGGVDETHKRIDDLSTISQDQLQYKLALFLVCAEKYSYLFLNDGYCVDTRGRKNICQSGLWLKSLPEYKKPLGPPKGPATRNGYIYTRDFEHASVWLDIEHNQGKVIWKLKDSTMDDAVIEGLNSNFAGYRIVDCAVQKRTHFYFVANKIYRDQEGRELTDQPLDGDKRVIRVIISKDPWAFAQSNLTNYIWPIYCEMTYPQDAIAVIDMEGSPFYGDIESQPQILPAAKGGPRNGVVTRIRPIGNSNLVMITTGRDALIRKGDREWARIGTAFEQNFRTYEGFRDFDGFSLEEIYAVGGEGGVFKFDGSTWKQVEFPTNIGVTSVCCGSDSNVYVGAGLGKIYRGKDDQWELIHDDDLAHPYRDMVWHRDSLWCCSDGGLWNFKDGKSVGNFPPGVGACCGHLSVRDGVLLTAGFGGAAWLDNDDQWHTLFLSNQLQE